MVKGKYISLGTSQAYMILVRNLTLQSDWLTFIDTHEILHPPSQPSLETKSTYLA